MTPSKHYREQASELIKRGFFSIAFQPIYDVRKMAPAGYEALLRGPKGSVLENPGRLFHTKGVMKLDMLIKIDIACMETALRCGRHFHSDQLLFVNVHGQTLKRISEDRKIFLSLLDKLGIKPGRIVLEISETTTGIHAESIKDHLLFLKRTGIRLALDDIGFSSPWLQHILLLNPEFIKMDHKLITRIHQSERKQNLVRGLMVLAQAMGSVIIAEGVELKEELDVVKKLDVNYAQGFHMGTPQPAKNWIRDYKKVENFPAILEEREEILKWL